MEKKIEDFDLVIVGAGPAGLSAGIYAGRAMLKTLILEKGNVGGRVYNTREIVNYPSVKSSTGPELMAEMEQHALSFGVEIRKETVKEINAKSKTVITRKGEYHSKAIIIATGTAARVLGIPGEKEFTGSGVAYCATCDAEFFKGQDIAVLGSGDQAIEEGMYLTKFASSVTVVVVHDENILDCNKIAAERAFANPKMKFLWNSTVTEIYGDKDVNGIKIKDIKTGRITDFPCKGIFMFCGMIPETEFIKEQVPIDKRGWIHTSEDMNTGIPGIYAAGDVRNKYLRQVSTAVGDGASAATAAERYITEMEAFRTEILESPVPVTLGFWNPDIPGSLDAVNKEQNLILSKAGNSEKFRELDITRNRDLAAMYNISLDNEKPFEFIRLEGGTVTKRY
jgi:thioredoxin reductase (NADPH)